MPGAPARRKKLEGGINLATVLIIEEQVDSAAALQRIIDWNSSPFELMGIVSNGIIGRAIVERQMPDIVLLSTTSLYMGGISFITAVCNSDYAPQIIQLYTEPKTVVTKDIPQSAKISICRKDLTAEALFRALERSAQSLRAGNDPGEGYLPVTDQRNAAIMSILRRKLEGNAARREGERFNLGFLDGDLNIAFLYPSGSRALNEITSKQLINQINSVLKQNYGGEAFPLRDNGIGVIIRGEETSNETRARYFFSSLVKSMRRMAESQLGVDIDVVWPETIYQFDTVHQGYEAACRMARYRYFLPETHLLDSHFLQENPVHADMVRIDTLCAELENAVIRSDAPQVSAALSTLYLTIVRPSFSFRALGYLREQLENVFNRLAAEMPSSSALVFPATAFADLEQEYLNMRAFFEEVMKESARQRSGTSPQVRKALAYLGQNYTRDISLDSAAEAVGISGGYLSRSFRRELGTTFVAYLTDLRIKRAKNLLQNSDLRVGEVSAAVGYRDEKYFCRVFRQITGSSPAEYRRKSSQKRGAEP